MTLVLLSGLSAGVLQDAHGNVIASRQVNVYARGTSTPVQVYADSAGSSPVTQPLTTDTSGQVPGYVAGGVSVDIVDALTGLRQQAEPVLANLVGDLTVIEEGPLNVQWAAYGAKGNDTTDDFTAIQNAINALPPRGSNFRTGGTVFLPNASYRTSARLVLPEGVKLLGESTEATRIIATAGFSAGTSMITNLHTDATQEAAYVENLTVHGNSAGGATVGDGILFDSLFVNTAVRHVKTQFCSGNGVHFKTTAANAGLGQAFLEDVNSSSNSLDQILIEQGFISLTIEDISLEGFAAGHHGLHLDGAAGTNGSYGRRVNLRNIYGENGVVNGATVLLNNVVSAHLDGVWQGGTQQTGQAIVRITGTSNYLTGSAGIEARSILGIMGNGTVIVDDQTNGKQVLSTGSIQFCDHYYSEAGKTPGLPSVPATGVAFANPFPYDCTVYITANAGGLTTVQVASPVSSFAAIPASAICAINWPAGVSYILVYASAPTWKWVTR